MLDSLGSGLKCDDWKRHENMLSAEISGVSDDLGGRGKLCEDLDVRDMWDYRHPGKPFSYRSLIPRNWTEAGN